MEFIQHLGFLSLLEVMTTFSPLVAQEMQHYHRNKHASPFVKSFWRQLIVGRKKNERRRRRTRERQFHPKLDGRGSKSLESSCWGNVGVEVGEVNGEQSELEETPLPPRGSKIERLRMRANGRRSGERGLDRAKKERSEDLLYFASQAVCYSCCSWAGMKPNHWFYWAFDVRQQTDRSQPWYKTQQRIKVFLVEVGELRATSQVILEQDPGNKIKS